MPAYLKIIALFLFILFQGRLSIAQRNHFEYITTTDGLSQNTIRSIVKDKYGFMWFATWNGLCRYDGYTFKVYRHISGDTNSLASSRIHYLYKDGEGILWITTFNYFVCRYNYKTDDFTRFKTSQLPKAIRDSTDRRRNLAHFYSLSSELQQLIGPFGPSSTGENVVFRTTPDNHGGINDKNVNCVYKDDCGILWLGTTMGGINKTDLKAQPFQTFNLSAAGGVAVNSPVRAIVANSSGVWAGTQDDGLVHISPTTKKGEQITTGTAGSRVRCLFKDSQDDIWIGYRTGLERYNAQQKKWIHYFNNPIGKTDDNDYRFSAIAEDPADHSIWLGTFNAIFRFDKASGRFEKQAIKFFRNSNAVSLLFDSKHNLWIGTEHTGIIQIRRNARTQAWTDTIHYNGEGLQALLPDNRVYTLAEDSTGNIWAGTANGLCRIDPLSGNIKTYTEQDGLADQYIAKVLPDDKGHIWISHKKGLSKLAISTGMIRNYTIKGNRGEYEFMDGSGYSDPATGIMYFGGMDGFVSFRPDKIKDNPFLPVVVFTELQILNKPVQVGQKVDDRVVLAAPLYLSPKLVLTHNDRSFSIEFAALHYSNPGKNQYAYMLQGQDKDWIYTNAARRIASYSNLPVGRYIFKVKASNSDGVWNPVPAMLQIEVLPPWWRTGWAYTGYVFLLGLAMYLVFRLIRKRQHYHRQILTERLKAEKAAEMDELKSRFFTNVSHEFRTPLTLLIDPLEMLLDQEPSTEKRKEYYTVMHRNARRLLVLINQFLDFRKLESGNQQLQVARQDMVAFVRNVAAAFSLQAEQRRINFTLQAQPEVILFAFDADVVSKILYNLVSNAFKFTPEGGKIAVSLTAADDNPGQVTLSVTDNGIGIPPELTEKIFDPFFQVERNGYRGGTGVGLSLTKELALLHKGSITLTSQPHVATCFTVTLSDLGGEVTSLQPVNAGLEEQREYNRQADPFGVPEPAAGTELPLVLVVEDNEDVRNYIKGNLINSYTLIEAANGLDGFEKAVETVPDLIISDIMMPGMDGLEFCKKLKTDEKTSHIPVILLTARQADQYQIEGYETGADAYMVKPFSTPLLLARISNLLESRKMLRELFSKSVGFDARLAGTNEADKVFLSKAAALVESNMADAQVNVEWLAEQLFMSRTQLYRKIKALTDQSVHEFVSGIRLNKAAELLLEGRYSVSEIAFMVGYTDATSFSRMFQKLFKQTPKKFSQQGNEGRS